MKTIHETLRMQYLSGVITEGEYNQKLEENLEDILKVGNESGGIVLSKEEADFALQCMRQVYSDIARGKTRDDDPILTQTNLSQAMKNLENQLK